MTGLRGFEDSFVALRLEVTLTVGDFGVSTSAVEYVRKVEKRQNDASLSTFREVSYIEE